MASNGKAKDLIGGVSSFAMHFYQKCAKSSDENVIVSPLSMATMLLCVAEAANGKAFNELCKILQLDADKEKNAMEISKLCDQLKGMSDGMKLSMVNQVFVHKEFKLNEDYRKLAIKKFGVDVDSISFYEKTQSAQAVNRFIEAKTMNKLNNVIEPNLFDGKLLRVILMNAISFDANWAKPFESIFTKYGNFNANGVTVSAQYMEEHGQIYNYGELNDLNAKALEMKYRDLDFSFVIILPNAQNGLRELESRLKDYDLALIDGHMSEELVHVFIPKFQIKSHIDPKEILKQMGLNEIFDDESSDLTKMLDPSMNAGMMNVRESFCVSKIAHEMVFNVDEAGTKAAAASYVQNRLTVQNAKVFRVDHPFFFFIRSNNLISIPILCGSIYEPGDEPSQSVMNWTL